MKHLGHVLRTVMLVGVLFSTPMSFATELQDAPPLDELMTELQKAGIWQKQKVLAKVWLGSFEFSVEDKIKLLDTLSKSAFAAGNYKDAIDFLTQQGELVEHDRLGDPYFNVVRRLGIGNYYLGQYQQAINHYRVALSLARQRDNMLEIAHIHNNIGLAYQKKNTLQRSLAHFVEADEIYQKYGDEQDKADILLNLAGVYMKQGDFPNAEKMLNTAATAFTKLNDGYSLALSQSTLGVLYTSTSRHEQARESYRKSISYFESTNDLFHLSSDYTNLARLNFSGNDLENAEKAANFAFYYAEKIQSPPNILGAKTILARVAFAKGELALSKSLAEEGLALSKELGSKEDTFVLLGMLGLIEAASGNFEQAQKYLTKQITHEQKRLNLGVMKELKEYRAKYEASELSREVESLKQEQRLQAVKEQQKMQMLSLVAVLILLSVITTFAIYRRSIERKAKLELSEKVAVRTAELQKTADELREAHNIKSRFLANMSHEIRTPLTAIIGHTEDLLSNEPLSTVASSGLQVIQNQGIHLKELVNDILDLSRIEAHKLTLEPADFLVATLMGDLRSMFHQAALQKGLEFRVENYLPDGVSVKLDFVRVKQILINLLSNAIKFTSSGYVAISVSEHKSGLQFTVTDTGIGIDRQQVNRIFEYFQQADNSITRRFGGSGLGLSLSHQLAEMMCGQIGVSSELGVGSEFSFYVPCNLLLAETTVEELQINSDTGLFCGEVLLVEDHPDNRQLFTRMLERLGVKVLAVDNGAAAVERCLSDFPDLVLMDIQMPKMDGVEALRIIREAGYDGPVYALTANVLAHEIKKYMDAGFTGHIGKPVNSQELRSILVKHLYMDHMQHEEKLHIDMSDLKLSFASTFEQERYALIDAWQVKDWQKLQDICHKLAGAAALFGYQDLASVTKALEKALKNKAENQYQSLFIAVCDELKSADMAAELE
ncbi:tetratricopeptide repeat protein [Pseudoalteromonas sp. T1lg65]|uniref:tetratricopeptide repeat-containing hybrid sensor histidine kinase/response regulator n=1 Tax=Pseudoalteromonas sp. T1lg65 TaxID=2077101 RepID=UPI003F7A8E0D